MGQILLQGFLVGLAYVAPIGMQNAYVINSAAKFTKGKSIQVALITIFFDISLALSCFFGIGLLLLRFKFLEQIILGVGSIAVCYIGYSLLKSKSEGIGESDLKTSLLATVAMCFTVTWFNPQAIIDGTMLVGGFKASLSPEQGYWFISGVALASMTWFMSLALLVNKFRHLMTAKVLTNVNRVCGVVIIYFGIRIGLQLFQ